MARKVKLQLVGFRADSIDPKVNEIGIPLGERIQFTARPIIKLGVSNAANIASGVCTEPWVSADVQVTKDIKVTIGINVNDFAARGLASKMTMEELFVEREGGLLPNTDAILVSCDGYNYFPSKKN